MFSLKSALYVVIPPGLHCARLQRSLKDITPRDNNRYLVDEVQMMTYTRCSLLPGKIKMHNIYSSPTVLAKNFGSCTFNHCCVVQGPDL